MTVTRGLALFVTVATAGVLLTASEKGTGSNVGAVRLKTISARVGSKGASLRIEASWSSRSCRMLRTCCCEVTSESM